MLRKNHGERRCCEAASGALKHCVTNSDISVIVPQTMPGFERVVIGMQEGEVRKQRVAPEEVYGAKRTDRIFQIKTQLPEGVTLPIGSEVREHQSDHAAARRPRLYCRFVSLCVCTCGFPVQCMYMHVELCMNFHTCPEHTSKQTNTKAHTQANIQIKA